MRYQINLYQSVHVETTKPTNVGFSPHIHSLALRVSMMANLYPSIVQTFKSPF